MDLIQEARNRGYRKGLAIRYCNHVIDYVEGDYFELEEGDVRAYKKPEYERKGFDDFTYDTLYDGISKEWTDIVK